MTAPLVAALQERLDVLQQLWAASDASGIVAQLYTPHTQITGAGTEPLYSGIAPLTELVDALLAEPSQAHIRLDRVVPLARPAAFSWVTWQVQPDAGQAFKMKSLFVWQRTPDGWRIVADMYAEGEIPA